MIFTISISILKNILFCIILAEESDEAVMSFWQEKSADVAGFQLMFVK